MSNSYQKNSQKIQTTEKGAILTSLEDLVREGAQKMLAQALEEEVKHVFRPGTLTRILQA